MRIWIYSALEHFFYHLVIWAEDMRRKFDLCEDCGKNRYTDKTCRAAQETANELNGRYFE